MDRDRLVSLWSGLFFPTADEGWEHLGLAGMAAFLLIARPRLVFGFRRWIPFLVAVAGFVVIPELVADTWLVGGRWLIYVQALAPAIIQPRHSGIMGRLFPYASGALVLAALALLNVRVSVHNREMEGLRALSPLIEPESDVQNLVPAFRHKGRGFGYNEIGQTPGWVTADQGGILDNDSARFFHVPLQRRPGPWLTRYRYIIARGEWPRVQASVDSRSEHPKLLGHKDDWYLFEHPPLRAGDVEALRAVQGWGTLRANTSLDQAPLTIDGQRFSTGFGTHVPSLIRVRLLKPARVFEGGYGIDDEGWKTVRVRFRIRDGSGRVLFLSEPISRGACPPVLGAARAPERAPARRRARGRHRGRPCRLGGPDRKLAAAPGRV